MLIWSIGYPQSAVTLYIYRVGWTYPVRNPITDLNLQKVLVVLRFQLDRSDRSALCRTWNRFDRSDRLCAPVRPVCQFWSSTYVLLFFGNACMPKNKPLNQNYLRTMINIHRPFFVLRTINSIGRILILLQADDETTCLGFHTCFMVADLAGTTSACCSMNSFLRIRCSLLFWVWDKPEGHHLGYKY